MVQILARRGREGKRSIQSVDEEHACPALGRTLAQGGVWIAKGHPVGVQAVDELPPERCEEQENREVFAQDLVHGPGLCPIRRPG